MSADFSFILPFCRKKNDPNKHAHTGTRIGVRTHTYTNAKPREVHTDEATRYTGPADEIGYVIYTIYKPIIVFMIMYSGQIQEPGGCEIHYNRTNTIRKVYKLMFPKELIRNCRIN